MYFFTPNTSETENYYIQKKYSKYFMFFSGGYEFVFNFVGSTMGWSCFYILIKRIDNTLLNMNNLSSSDFLLFIFFLLSLTGHLPQTILGIIDSFKNIIEITSKKIG
ncbi:MAG: hypothetical protein A2161_02065 [Candidatus Schekmanbacteria bacterium RBG_13_48_7]|uniref:Uncharacterized protein n=1 Tax=Candidatus Schekmanbacteria bacterium RBG_13_48_7 TaxID=1817878 RepID=A0A1F7RWH3_9BACT|nr:MAG: hypothetical protein A2161_02065 [Candidatus Schekmanbacteria bacterium RBG_13_48_7]